MRKHILHIECVLSLSYLLCEYLVGSVKDGSPQVNKFIEKLKLIIDSQERLDALKEFAARHEAEKEREINETIMAKESEKERAVKAVELRMALGTFLCTLSYIQAALEHIYRNEVEICNTWKRYRPTKIHSDDELNRLTKRRYFKWIGFMNENRSKHHVWKGVREQVPKKYLFDFAWSMPKMYYFCRDYIEGKRSHSLNEYVRLRAEGTKKTLLEFLYKHSQWFLTKKDLDFLNILLRAAQFDEVGYEWLDRQAKLVIPYSSGDICLPPDKHFVVPNDTATYWNLTRRRNNRLRKIPTSSTRGIVNLPVILDK